MPPEAAIPPDAELLRRYVEGRDEAAFAEVVRRHADFVYSVAVRVTANGALAQDATQQVFTKLAQQAHALCHYDTLVGWLHTTARYAAINLVRGEARRRAREQEAATMQDPATTPEVNWTEIGPLLDEAISTLAEPDQKAVLLRYFKNQSHQEVGAALGLSEDTARKRVERALEKLRGHFSRRGVTLSSALLATAMSENSVQAAPVGLARKVVQRSLAGAAGAGLVSAFSLFFIMSTKTKIALAVAVLLVIATLALWWQNQNTSRPAVPSLAASVFQPAAANTFAPALTQVVVPVVPPAVPGASPVADTAQPAASAPARPGATPPELQSAIAEIIADEQAGDSLSIQENFMPPEELAAMTPRARTFMENEILRGMQNSKPDSEPDAFLEIMQTLASLTPTFDESGDTASFKVPITESGKNNLLRQGFKPSDIPSTITETFVKRNGKWYMKNLAYPIETSPPSSSSRR